MADELVDILTSDGNLSGEIKLKSEAHKNGLWHASVQIWIYTPGGNILLQKRAPNKDTYPNLWDISVAGHLTAGDTPIVAALREIEEEIGLTISDGQLQFLKTIKKSKQPSSLITDNEFNELFLCEHTFKLTELTLQTEEVADIQFISVHDFEKELQQNPKKFVPHGTEYYEYILNQIKKALALNK